MCVCVCLEDLEPSRAIDTVDRRRHPQNSGVMKGSDREYYLELNRTTYPPLTTTTTTTMQAHINSIASHADDDDDDNNGDRTEENAIHL